MAFKNYEPDENLSNNFIDFCCAMHHACYTFYISVVMNVSASLKQKKFNVLGINHLIYEQTDRHSMIGAVRTPSNPSHILHNNEMKTSFKCAINLFRINTSANQTNYLII